MTFSSDYQERAQAFGFASPDAIQRALQDDEHTYVLDVRTPDEIAASGKVHHPHWATTRCTPQSCDALAAHPEEFVRNKDEAVVVLYCRSGRRASKAKEILQAKGYRHVLNAGGYDDVVEIQKGEW
mmetsp:Transcript_14185/g.32257  ORF Transcript_14185/g.32257 Transcript_14185/m.32257 type:complete len:126 (+) Transcript_14185:80-457(+)